VEDLEHLKVDILANRGLSQLIEIDPTRKLTDYPEEDYATSQLLCRGDVLGVTQAESPAMRRLFRAIQPKSRRDCVFGTALIRPVAVSGRKKATMFHDWSKERMSDTIVYEDDAIDRISDVLDIDKYEADMYRRAFAKKNEEKIMEFITRLGNHPRKDEIITMLQSLSGFGLCRAHAVNLGRLIWALAYQKAHNPKKFWQACLKHCHGSYKRWVYRTEAKRVGINVVTPSNSDRWDTPEFQYRKYGWWSQKEFMPGMYVRELYLDKVEFAGMIANGRVFRGDKGRYVTFLTLGVGNGQYIDVTIKKAFAYSDHDVVWGQGTIRHSNNSDYVECYDSKGFGLEKFIKIMYTDSDVFAMPSAPNIFQMYPQKETFKYCRYPRIETANTQAQYDSFYHGLYTDCSLEQVKLKGFQTGVFMLTKKAREIMKPWIAKFKQLGEYQDGEILNWATIKSDVPVTKMNEWFNFKNAHFENKPKIYFFHAAGRKKGKKGQEEGIRKFLKKNGIV
jgi:hypothetical protein